ncbi:putative invertase inhibitor [Apium graveolens]|uniref:putative invertase inhibitor n=1 Tax=Apium graveolens TaxID=4045 RepID=UPI003D7ACB47
MWSNSCITSIFFFTTLVLSILHISTSHTLIPDICNHVSRDARPPVPYGFCMRSLLAVRGSRHATLEGLGIIVMKLTNHTLTDTGRYIKALTREKELDEYVRTKLESCFRSYWGSISSIKSTIDCYKSKNFDDANIQLGSVQDEAASCDEEFEGFIGFVSPLTARDRTISDLATIAVKITNRLRDGIYT